MVGNFTALEWSKNLTEGFLLASPWSPCVSGTSHNSNFTSITRRLLGLRWVYQMAVLSVLGRVVETPWMALWLMMALTNSLGEPWGPPPMLTWVILNPIWEFTELQNWGSASFLSDSLKSGETLPQPSNLESPNGMYKFAFQDDDNLVIYDIYDRVIWKTDTTDQCQDASAELVFQTNGNLELLCGNSKLWESGTATDVNICRAVYMQNDGALAMYNANDQSGVWSSSGSVPIGFGSNNLTSPEILNVGQRLVESYYGQYELSIVAGMLVLREWQKLGGVKHVFLARPFRFWASLYIYIYICMISLLISEIIWWYQSIPHGISYFPINSFSYRGLPSSLGVGDRRICRSVENPGRGMLPRLSRCCEVLLEGVVQGCCWKEKVQKQTDKRKQLIPFHASWGLCWYLYAHSFSSSIQLLAVSHLLWPRKSSIWSSDAGCTNSTDAHLKMQQDGNLVLYCDKANTVAPWATDTSDVSLETLDGHNILSLLPDGNLQIINKRGEITWLSGSAQAYQYFPKSDWYITWNFVRLFFFNLRAEANHQHVPGQKLWKLNFQMSVAPECEETQPFHWFHW